MDGGYQPMGSPEAPQAGSVTEMPTKDKRARVEAAFDGRLLNWKDACSALQNEFAIGSKKSQYMVSALVREGMLMKNGQQGDPKTYYKFIGGLENMPDEPVFVTEPTLFDPPPSQNGHTVAGDGFQTTEDLPF
jgi:hypothetical protein